MDFPARLNRRHKAVLFLTLLATGTGFWLRADVKQTAGVILIGIALAWMFGSDSRAVHWLLVTLSLVLLLVGFFSFYLPLIQSQKDGDVDLAFWQAEASFDEKSELRRILDSAVTPPEKSPTARFMLLGQPLSNKVKREAWNRYGQAKQGGDFGVLFNDLDIPSETKKQLFELKRRADESPVAPPAEAHKPVPKLRTFVAGLRDAQFWLDESPGLLLLGVGVALLLKVRPRHG